MVQSNLFVPVQRFGPSVCRRPAHRLLFTACSVLVGLCLRLGSWLGQQVLLVLASFPTAWPNRSFNRTQNGVRRFVPSLALSAG